jgi:enoyl-CoA hydratase/carnithine racemase
MEMVQDHEFIRLEKQDKQAWVTFCREDHLNAVNNACTEQILDIARALNADKTVRVIVIRGQGRAFCTGIDLKELANDRIEMSYHQRWESALRLFETMEKLVIVGMHGYCLGGALQLSLAADIRVSTAGCMIGLPAIKESLIPGLGTWRLPRYIGWGRAKKMVLGGQNIQGEEALKIGLVDHIVPEKDFFAHVDRVARDYLAACSTGNRMSKLMVGHAFDMDYDEALSTYFRLQDRAQSSPDAREAKWAYLAGETPRWE